MNKFRQGLKDEGIARSLELLQRLYKIALETNKYPTYDELAKTYEPPKTRERVRQMINRLVKNGYVFSVRSPNNKMVYLLTLSGIKYLSNIPQQVINNQQVGGCGGSGRFIRGFEENVHIINVKKDGANKEE